MTELNVTFPTQKHGTLWKYMFNNIGGVCDQCDQELWFDRYYMTFTLPIMVTIYKK